MLRCLVDAMIFDAIVADPTMLAGVDRLTSARRLELLAAVETMREIGATPDRAHRRRLQRVRVLVVPPADRGRAPTRAALAALHRRPGVSEQDAGVAVAAAFHRVPLVTEDGDLRVAVTDVLPEVETWTWTADLRPRLVALGAGGDPD